MSSSDALLRAIPENTEALSKQEIGALNMIIGN
jgi:hypothetical protein